MASIHGKDTSNWKNILLFNYGENSLSIGSFYATGLFLYPPENIRKLKVYYAGWTQSY